MVSENTDEKFGNDEWADESGPGGPGNEEKGVDGREEQYSEPRVAKRKAPKKKVSRRVQKESNPERPSAEEAMKTLQAQMLASAGTPKGPKGKLSMGKGGLSSPFAMCLVSAIIALVLAVAVNLYFSPSRTQFTKLTNEHNALNSSVDSINGQLSTKASSADLGAAKGNISALQTSTGIDHQNLQTVIDWKNGLDFTQYLKVAEVYSFGGNVSGNVSGNLSSVLSNYWTKWSTLGTAYDVLNISVNTSLAKVGALNSSVVNLSSTVSNLSVGNLSGGIVTVGNCSNCSLSDAIKYVYNGSRSGNWTYPNNYP